jgi:hypothetical protein
MEIIVKDITGPYAIAPDAGQALYQHIYPALIAGQAAVLDFSEIKVFASPFFNVAIGQLLKDLSPEQLNQRLKIEQLNDQGQSVLARVVENAKRYYSDPNYQCAVDKAIEEYASSC